MWEITKEILTSEKFLNAIFFLVIGAIVGAILSVKYSLRAQRPKLIIIGNGSGGNRQKYSWNITILNKPSFIGQALDGESARDVYAQIRLDEKKCHQYYIYWGQEMEHRVTIEPGKQELLKLFHWQEGSEGYCIVDGNGEPIARFQNRELKFILTLRDLLQRKSEFRFTVEFDDTHLKKAPELQIVFPKRFSTRLRQAKKGLRYMLSAFKSR